MTRTLVFTLLSALCLLGQERPPVPQFILRLEPVRKDFAIQNMTDEERRIGMEHMRYLKRLQSEGKLSFAGQVWDAKGFWGIAVLNVADAQTAAAVIEADPAYSRSCFGRRHSRSAR